MWITNFTGTTFGLYFKGMFNSIKGYRTYICAAGGAATVALYLLGIFDAETANALLFLFGFGGLAGLRAAL